MGGGLGVGEEGGGDWWVVLDYGAEGAVGVGVEGGC